MFVIKIVFKDLDREGNHVYTTFEYADEEDATKVFDDILYEFNNLNHINIDVADNLRYIYASDTIQSVVMYKEV